MAQEVFSKSSWESDWSDHTCLTRWVFRFHISGTVFVHWNCTNKNNGNEIFYYVFLRVNFIWTDFSDLIYQKLLGLEIRKIAERKFINMFLVIFMIFKTYHVVTLISSVFKFCGGDIWWFDGLDNSVHQVFSSLKK